METSNVMLTLGIEFYPNFKDAIVAEKKAIDNQKKRTSVNVFKEIRTGRSRIGQWFYMKFLFVPFNEKHGNIFDCLSLDPSNLDFGTDKEGKPNSETAQTYFETAEKFLTEYYDVHLDILKSWNDSIKHLENICTVIQKNGKVEISLKDWEQILDITKENI